MFTNFNKSHYLELLKPTRGKPKYICFHTAVSFFFKKERKKEKKRKKKRKKEKKEKKNEM